MQHAAHTEIEKDLDLVAMWIRKDVIRWIAGIMAGILAMVVAMVVAMLLSVKGGNELLYPIKIGAVPLLGSTATEFGMHMGVLVVGALWYAAIGALLGLLYAHFAFTNYVPALLGMGFTWGAFSWVFICNLFMPSFFDLRALAIPNGATFLICMAFGFSLVSVAFFDRMIRGSK